MISIDEIFKPNYRNLGKIVNEHVKSIKPKKKKSNGYIDKAYEEWKRNKIKENFQNK